MSRRYTPLTAETVHKNLVYVSTAKLDQLLLKNSRPGFNLTLPGQLGGASREPRNLGIRELLESAATLFEEQQNLIYEEVPQVGEWLMVRFQGKCGTAWPWSGISDDFRNTAWWTGYSEKLQLLAYGHNTHILGNGLMPVADPVATWWPSTPGSYRNLLESVAELVNADSLGSDPPLGSMEESAATFRGLLRYFFNDSVERGTPLIQAGVYEMLLRVDGVEQGEGDERPVVFGSPLWVAKVTWAVPGTYIVQSLPETSEVSVVASWDGHRWSDLRVNDEREDFMKIGGDNITLPAMPADPPNLEDLADLQIRSCPDADKSAHQPISSQTHTSSWFARLWRGIFRP